MILQASCLVENKGRIIYVGNKISGSLDKKFEKFDIIDLY